MICIIPLFCLISSLCVAFISTLTVYQAEEDDSCTIGWDINVHTDMSLSNMICFYYSQPPKVLYEMVDGVEMPKSWDQQFVGRVLCDRDALREGRVRLHLSRLSVKDSGSYWCELVANYDESLEKWDLETSESFILNVTQTSNVEVCLPTSAPESGDERPPLQTRAAVICGMAVVAVAVTAFVSHVAVMFFTAEKIKIKSRIKTPASSSC